jgi:azurin
VKNEEIPMPIARPLACAALVLSILAPVHARQAAPRVVQIDVGDNMKFSVPAISARPGETLKIVLKGVGQMPKVAMGHNFVLLKKGTDPKKFVDASMNARDTDFIAASVKDEVIASTKLVGPGETVETTFAAPRQPGDYTFLCSFPGHYALGMKGTLTVK